MDYTVPSIGREFGSVFLGDKNVALLVVSEGWAKVISSLFQLIDITKGFTFDFFLFVVAESCSSRSGSRVNRKEKQVLSSQNFYVWKIKLSNKVLVAGARLTFQVFLSLFLVLKLLP